MLTIAPQTTSPPTAFHPITARWFHSRFREPTEPQRLGWPEILAGHNTLIAAPTGSGKTLAAFLACIDRLLRAGLEGTLSDATEVLYISPLKALSNDIRRNLEVPLEEIRRGATETGYELPDIRVQVRTGDTTPSERQAMLRKPPHILVTTPESFYLLLTSAKGRDMLRTVRTVIVDEIHALARDKRGSHLALSLERLEALCDSPPVRIGLSATQRPIDEIARFLVGSKRVDPSGIPDCRIIDAGHLRNLDLEIEVAETELSAVCSHEMWDEVYHRLAELIQSHHSTLVFVNTRRMAERVCHHLTQLLGNDAVASHHGSLSRQIRLAAEERLKAGELKAIVATASLELGIDIGYIDLVCQIGSPRAIATFLQRAGRAGHSLGVIPKARLFALTRDELIEAMALIRAVRHGRLDQVEIPVAPLDILAQQIVAAAACEEWNEDALYELCRGAWPYRNLSRKDFDAIVAMLSEGIGRSNRRGAYLHRDIINRRLRPRRSARLAALTSGGAIPENADYRVVTESERAFVGTLNEDFAIESLAGDVFILGNTSWRIKHVRGGEVVVNDAQGAPATIPFWLGEAPGRTVELSAEVSDLREELASRVVTQPTDWQSELEWLRQECGVNEWAGRQALEYVAAQKAAIGLAPTQKQIVFERFFDEAGGMQLVIHSPYGARINRAWGLALRKRFCRQFDFELQASADDDGIVLSLGPQHSFPIEQLLKFLHRQNAEHMLTQALLAVPMFQIRWRWNLTRALAVLRQNGGKKIPPPLQRMRADDLLTAVFPAQTACFENRPEDVEIPDHPLVNQTVYDCLHEAMDLERWLQLIGDIQDGKIELTACDTREPSPFSYERLNAQPYAFLDDAPLEERRARAVATRRTLSVEDVRDLGRLDPAAIAQVRAEAWPLVRDVDELHDALLIMKALPEQEGEEWTAWFQELVNTGRATTVRCQNGPRLWIATECWPLVQAALPESVAFPAVSLPDDFGKAQNTSEAWVELVRGRLSCTGPTTANQIAADLGLTQQHVQLALAALEGEGFALRGRFTDNERCHSDPCGFAQGRLREESLLASDHQKISRSARNDNEHEIEMQKAMAPQAPQKATSQEWCERRLLARIHRLTLESLRRQIQPSEPHDFMRFLIAHQHLSAETCLSGERGLAEIIAQLQGFEIPAAAWERDILSRRLENYDPVWLDHLSLSGEAAWGRLRTPVKAEDDTSNPVGYYSSHDASPVGKYLSNGANGSTLTRVVPISLALRQDLPWLLSGARKQYENHIRSNARLVLETLASHGALFFDDLLAITQLLPAQLEEALSELAALGLVTADGFAALRAIVSPNRHSVSRRERNWPRRNGKPIRPHSRGGRWTMFPGKMTSPEHDDCIERWAWQLLSRYGIMFRDLLVRESVAPPWKALLPVYRRLEARGEIRGGRFVNGVAGEQFATPEAVERLRRVRDQKPNGEWLMLSACDPVNLFGIATLGLRIPAVRTNMLVVQDGRLIASKQAGEVQFHEEVGREVGEEMRRAMRHTDLPRVYREMAIGC
jgi:ATP-dependent Lhr-like helicase